MSIVRDSYSLDTTSSPGFIQIAYESDRETAAGGLRNTATLWFERANVARLAAALGALVANEDAMATTVAGGADSLKVNWSGPDQAPYMNVRNTRAESAEHGGYAWISMSKALAEKLATELGSIR